MNILNSVPETRHGCDCKAKKDDLCLALQRSVNSLYLLAFLLTASHVEAERCIEILIDRTFEDGGIKKHSLASWLRFSLIEIAVNRFLRKRGQLKLAHEHWFRIDTNRDVDTNADDDAVKVIDAVIQLSSLPRIVFVITVLERQSDETCAALLRCSISRVIRARELAFRRLSQSVSTMPGAFESMLLAHV